MTKVFVEQPGYTGSVKNQIIEDLKSVVHELMESLKDQRESMNHYKEAFTDAFKKLKEAKGIMTELKKKLKAEGYPAHQGGAVTRG